jgi:hypothetical protein
MALVNPNIAMSYRGIELPQQNALADYAAVQQIQGGRQTQELNQMKMQEYERARTEEEGLRNYLAQADLAKPDTRANLLRYGKTGLAYGEALAKQDTAALTQREAAFKVQKAKSDFIAQAKRDTSQNPSDANLTAFKEDLLANPLFTEPEKLQLGANIDRILTMPVDQRRTFMASQGASASELKPVLTPQNLGGTARILSTPAFGGVSTPVEGSVGTVTAAPAAPPVSVAEFERAKTDPAFMKFLQDRAAATRPPRPEAAPRTQQVTLSDGSLGIVNMDTGVITPSTVGGAPVKGKGSKELAISEQQASYNIGRILDAAKEINAAIKKDPSALKPSISEAAAASVGLSGTANLARNAQRQIVFGAQRDALDAMLYLATGAAYNKEQLEGQMAAYVPAFTDKPDAVEAKRTRMLGLIQNAKVRAGKAWTPELDAASQVLFQPTVSGGKPAAGGIAPPPGFTADSPN